MLSAQGAAVQKSPWKVYSIMLIALFVLVSCLAMHTPAYPIITEAFHIDSAYSTWMTAFYALSACVLAPVMGRLGDMYGMKKVLIFGCAMFSFGTFLCFSSIGYFMVLLGNFAQGIGIACSMPAAMAFVSTSFLPKDMTKGFAYFSVSASLGSMVGPTVSGLIIDRFGWRTVYLVGTVVTALLPFLLAFVVPKAQGNSAIKNEKFDVGGTIALVVAVGSILLLPTIGSQFGWFSPLSFVLAILFLVFGALFIRTENRVHNPLIDLKMLANKNFLIPVLMLFLVGGTNQPYMYMNSYFMTAGLGMPTTYSGMMTSTLFLSSVILSMFFVAPLIEKVSWKKLAFGVAFLMFLAFGMLSFAGAQSTFLSLALSAVLLGITSALGGTLTMTMALQAVPPDKQGVGSGTYRMLGDLGGPLLVAIYIPLLSTIGASPQGVPNFLVSFPRVNMLYLIVVAFVFLLAFGFPNTSSKASKAKKAKK